MVLVETIMHSNLIFVATHYIRKQTYGSLLEHINENFSPPRVQDAVQTERDKRKRPNSVSEQAQLVIHLALRK